MPRQDFKDRRVFQRIPTRVSLRLRNMRSHDWTLAETRDISAKGLGIITEEELSPQTPLELWLPIVNKGESFYTRGEVVYSEMLTPDRYRIGVNLAKAELLGISQVLRGV